VLVELGERETLREVVAADSALPGGHYKRAGKSSTPRRTSTEIPCRAGELSGETHRSPLLLQRRSAASSLAAPRPSARQTASIPSSRTAPGS
jgi:hypothetical protein